MKILKNFIIKKKCQLFSQKSYIVDVWLGSKYACEVLLNLKGRKMEILEFLLVYS